MTVVFNPAILRQIGRSHLRDGDPLAAHALITAGARIERLEAALRYARKYIAARHHERIDSAFEEPDHG